MKDVNPVLVVGAGPVGFVATLRLAQNGIPVVLIDKETTLQDDLRASTFHPPTLEMLDELDLAAGLLALGLKTDSWQIRMHETHERAVFDLSLLADDTRYPFRLQAEQRSLCALAASRVTSEPLVDYQPGHELIDIAQNDNEVTATLKGGAGEERRIVTPWLIAADGAGSRVRELLELEFAGLTYPETTILATTHFPFEEHLPGLSNVNYVWFKGGTFSLLRLPDIWRCSLYSDAGETEADALEPASIERKLQHVVPKNTPYEVEEIRPYRIHQRILKNYRVGRILLAGDAAHLNSPSGGMGMNGGIHDAFNLTEKLTAVWRGDSPPEFLDLYSRQRQPIAEDQILKQAHTNRSRMQEKDPAVRAAELQRLLRIASDREACREYLLRSSMIAGLRQAAEIV